MHVHRLRDLVFRLAALTALPLAVLVALCAGLTALEAGESAEARLRARVREYTEPSTSDLRRDLIVFELTSPGAAPEAALGKLAREALVSDVRRAGALDLAARMRLPGVFDTAKRHADGPCAAGVAALALAAPEPAAGAWLAARWTASAADSEAFRTADLALRERRAPPGAVEGIARSLDDPVRAEPALAILRVQMAVDDPCPDELRARWDDAWKRYLFEAEEVPAPGADLLAAPGWKTGRARRVGRNLRVPPLAALDLPTLPLPVLSGTGNLRLRVAAGEGKGAYVGLVTEGAQDLRLQCDGAVWFLVEGPPRDGARVEAPFAPSAWSEIEFRMSDPRLPGRAAVRDVRVTVDGRELRPSGGFWRLASPPRGLSVGAAAGAEPTVVGGVRWRAE